MHLSEAAHAFSHYAARHPFQCALEAVCAVALVATLAVVLEAAEPARATLVASKASPERQAEAPAKWVWTKRVDRGSQLYPVAP